VAAAGGAAAEALSATCHNVECAPLRVRVVCRCAAAAGKHAAKGGRGGRALGLLRGKKGGSCAAPCRLAFGHMGVSIH